jgi:hypothetical protein
MMNLDIMMMYSGSSFVRSSVTTRLRQPYVR